VQALEKTAVRYELGHEVERAPGVDPEIVRVDPGPLVQGEHEIPVDDIAL